MSADRHGVVVGVDIGGTKVLAGVVDETGGVSDTALRTPALDQDFSYRALAEGTAGSTGRHAEAPAAGTGTAPWSSGTTSSTTGSQEDPR